MVDVYQCEYKIYTDKDMTELLGKSISDWLFEFDPTHFISIQFPTEQRSYSLEKSLYKLKAIMKIFEKTLNPRHWYKKHLQFIGFAENTSGMWHFHLLLKNDRYPEEKILSGMDTTAKKFAFSEDVIDIQPIDRTPEHLHSYVNKELTADKNGNFNSFRIILSSDMFNLPVKQSIQSHKPSVVAPNSHQI